MKEIERLSDLCEQKGGSKTHIAFLGTALIAKATEPTVDLFAIKPSQDAGNPRAFSARTLAEKVLVPAAAEFGVDIGVTGRQPLNNQPYFRMKHLDDGAPVRKGAVSGFRYMLRLVDRIQKTPGTIEAKRALHAFITVRRRFLKQYDRFQGTIELSPIELTAAIDEFVKQNSEGGRRAQAVAAGLMDVFAGADLVESGRINDPSRHHPGDVCIGNTPPSKDWAKAMEVRDKPVSESDVRVFGKKCIDFGVQDASVLMVSDLQQTLDNIALEKWAAEFGLGLTLFFGWNNFVDQTLFWSNSAKPTAAAAAVSRIDQRLISIETSTDGILLWRSLTSKS